MATVLLGIVLMVLVLAANGLAKAVVGGDRAMVRRSWRHCDSAPAAASCCGLDKYATSSMRREPNLQDRIYGGKKASQYQFPWIVRLYCGKKTYSTCSGTLIGPQHVITSRHCCNDIHRRFKIGLGCPSGNDSNRCSVYINSSRYFCKQRANEQQLDLAIIKLEKPTNYTGEKVRTSEDLDHPRLAAELD